VVTKVRSSSSASRLSSRSPSNCHSPAGSVSSHAWTPDTRTSSPTNSVCSFDELATKTPPPASENGEPQPQQADEKKKRVKKVSFSLPQGEAYTPSTFRPPSVNIRPDSPTLGFDDAYFHMGASLPELPAIPKPALLPTETDAASDDAMGDSLDEESFNATRMAHRYFADLSVLRGQLTSHAAELDRLLAAGASPTVPDALLERPESRTTTGEDLRALDRQARIERLRQSGWQRKRFDPRRYEELRESVLAELGA
jgi:hypothetical protein